MKVYDRILAFIVKRSTGTLLINHNFPDIDFEIEVVNILKKHEFVEHAHFWTKGFVNIYLKKEGVFICHNIDNKTLLRLTKVSNPLLTLNEWIKHFSKI